MAKYSEQVSSSAKKVKNWQEVQQVQWMILQIKLSNK